MTLDFSLKDFIGWQAGRQQQDGVCAYVYNYKQMHESPPPLALQLFYFSSSNLEKHLTIIALQLLKVGGGPHLFAQGGGGRPGGGTWYAVSSCAQCTRARARLLLLPARTVMRAQ